MTHAMTPRPITTALAQRNGHHPKAMDRFGVDWSDRAVLVVGLGKSGIAAARLLHRIGCRVRMTELADSEPLQARGAELRASGVAEVEVGRHSRRMFDGADLVVVSPGVPDAASPVRWAEERGTPIISEIELAFRFCAAPIVAVTGTNGKSSVVTLIQRLLQAAGRPAVACGNLGTPFADVMSTMTTSTVAVVEVSSFQLERCETFRPAIGVLLNLGVNHLDRHQDRPAYIAAKARLFQRQTPQDVAVLNAHDPHVVALSRTLHAQRIWFGDRAVNPPAFRLDDATQRVLPDNMQAVLQVGRLLGIPDPLTYQTIREFRGLEHRLEYLLTTDGVRLINDSKSTTPDSLLYALAQCPGSLVPIVGGRDKGLDFEPLGPALTQERVRGVVLIGESRRRIRTLLNGSTTAREGETLEEAVREAMRLAHPGDTILFSPGCASFDMFRNFEERGRAFKALARRLGQAVQTNGHQPG